MDSQEQLIEKQLLDLSPVIGLNNSNSINNNHSHNTEEEEIEIEQETSNKISNNKPAPLPPQLISQHKFEVVTFHQMERCELCGGILYGLGRQAVKCREKSCAYLCHPKCRGYLPANCPININQRFQLKAVDFAKGMGTLMQGHLKMPKAGGVKKGWQDNYVYLSNARLFIYPILDGSSSSSSSSGGGGGGVSGGGVGVSSSGSTESSKHSLLPSQIVDIRSADFSVSSVTEADVIHASRRDVPCILKMIVTKLRQPVLKQKLLFCAKDENEKTSWINVLKDLNERLTRNGGSGSSGVAVEAREVVENTSAKNVNAACLYDYDRVLLASDDGIDVVDTRDGGGHHRIYDKKTFKVNLPN